MSEKISLDSSDIIKERHLNLKHRCFTYKPYMSACSMTHQEYRGKAYIY